MSGGYDYLNSAEYKEQRQRHRLCTAFVQALADHGYEATTVARVSELSGCSTDTFHRYYEGLVDCFRDACSHTLQESRSASVSAWLTARGWSQRLRRSCLATLTHVEEHPTAARAVLVAALTGGAEVSDHVRETFAFHERVLVMAFQLHPQGFATSRLTPRALTGGMRHFLHLRMREGGERQLAELAGDLQEWIECHRAPAAARLAIDQPRHRPEQQLHGRPMPPSSSGQMPPIFPGEDERARVLDTVAHLLLQESRDTLDDATAARFAGISAARFASDYGGLQFCVTQMVDDFVEQCACAFAVGAARGSNWPESVRLGVVEWVRHLDAHRQLARLVLLRLSLVPAVAAARHAALAQRIVAVALTQAPPPRHGGALMPDALVGAVSDLLAWSLKPGTPSRLPALGDHIAFFLLAPYLGGGQAADVVIASADAESPWRQSGD